MRKTIVLAIAALILVSPAVTAAKMPSGSFLKSHVTSVAALTEQVNDDAIVAARYVRCFATPRNAIVDYFERNLRIGRLRNDYEATVYTVSGRVEITTTQRVLAKGSYVFVAPNGMPILEANTGNPLANFLPLPVAASVPEGTGAAVTGSMSPTAGATATGTISAPAEGVVTKVLGAAPAELGAEAAASAGPLVVPAAGIEPAVDIVAAIPTSAVSGPAFGLANFGKILPIAAAIGGVAMAGAGGGHQSSSVNPPVTPVPEPAGLIVLLLGASAIGFRRFRFRK